MLDDPIHRRSPATARDHDPRGRAGRLVRAYPRDPCSAVAGRFPEESELGGRDELRESALSSRSSFSTRASSC